MALPGVCTTADCPDPLLNVIAIIEDYGWALASMAHTINVYITVLVTVHRYITVCLPPHFAARFSTHKQAWIQLGFVCIFGILYNIPRIFEYTVEKDQIHRKVTPYGKNIWYQVLYKNICYYLLLFIIPFTILTVLSYKLSQVIRKRLEHRKKLCLKKRHGREDNTTFVLIVIVAIFVLCQTPTIVQRLFYTLYVESPPTGCDLFFYLSRMTNYLVILNCSCNFVVYVLFAGQFRQTLWHILCKCTEKNQQTRQALV